MNWMQRHFVNRPYARADDYPPETRPNTPQITTFHIPPTFSRQTVDEQLLFVDKAFNNHAKNDGSHVSPFDNGLVSYGLDDLQVRLLQGIDEQKLKQVLSRTLRATTGISPDAPIEEEDWEEMLRGGLQSALESQVIVFEITGASRALTHQLVRTRKAAFHQQSQRATWYGERPWQRWPMSILRAQEDGNTDLHDAWEYALLACWAAYKLACEAGVSYQDARYILPEGTCNYIICEYPLREFLATYAYRACSMFLWEMVGCMRQMGRALVQAHPFLEPHIKISCEKGAPCPECDGEGAYYTEWNDEAEAIPHLKALVRHYPDPPDGTVLIECQFCKGLGSRERKCTFQGWENVEQACDFPWARQSNRVFLPDPKYRIGG